MPTASELISQINALEGDERSAVLTLLANDGGGVVKEFRSKQFAAGKSEGGKSGKAVGEELVASKTRVEELELELVEVKAKAPDAAKIEAALKEKHAKELQKRDERITSLTGETRTLKAATPRAKLAKELGAFVVDDWQDDIAARYADRIHVDEADGSVKVLKLGETTAYEAGSEDEAVKLLAGDIRKSLKPQYLRGNGDSGGGVGGGGGGGPTTNPKVEERRVEQARAIAEGAI